MKFLVLFVLLFAHFVAFAQSGVTGNYLKLNPQVLPITCPQGMVRFDGSGNILKVCTTTNTWTGANAFSPIAAYTTLSNNTSSSAVPLANSSLILGVPGFSDTGVATQLSASVAGYYQQILQNKSSNAAASADFIVANDQATSTTHYGDLGINSSGFTGSGSLNIPGATYLYSQNGDLVLGTQTSNAIHMLVNGGTTDAATITSAGVLQLPALSTAGILTNDTSGNVISTVSLAVGKGGTGQTTVAAAFTSFFESVATTLGDLVYGGASGAPTRLAGPTSATKQFMTSTGTGSAAQAPAWGTIASGDVPTLNQNTSGTAAGLSSTLVVASGGTGDASVTAYAPLAGGTTTTGAFQSLTSGMSTTGFVLTSNGTSAVPTWQAATPSFTGLTQYGAVYAATTGTIASTLAGTVNYPLVANTGAAPTFQQLSLTAGVTGTLPIANGGSGLTSTSQNFAFIGPTSGSGAPTWRALVAGDIPSLSATYLSVANNLSDLASRQTALNNLVGTVGSATYLRGNGTNIVATTNVPAGDLSGQVAPVHGGTGLSSLTVYGLIFGGTTTTGNFQQIGVGTSGQALVSGGAAVLPAWTTLTAPTQQIFTAAVSGASIAGYEFQVSGVTTAPVAGDTYTNNSVTYTVVWSGLTKTRIIATAAAGAHTFSGTTLTRTAGSGDASITFVGTTTQTAYIPQPFGTYTTPAGARLLKVTAVGGGGGGGGGASTAANSAAGGGGGGAGGFVQWIASPAATYYYSVAGLSGFGSSGNNPGLSGPDTLFATTSIAYLGVGGKGGFGCAASTVPLVGQPGAAGGFAGLATFESAGSPGGPGMVLSTTIAAGGAGGGSMLGAAQANTSIVNTNGQSGSNYGSGGTGGQTLNGGSATLGGQGTTGIIIVEEYYQ